MKVHNMKISIRLVLSLFLFAQTVNRVFKDPQKMLGQSRQLSGFSAWNLALGCIVCTLHCATDIHRKYQRICSLTNQPSLDLRIFSFCYSIVQTITLHIACIPDIASKIVYLLKRFDINPNPNPGNSPFIYLTVPVPNGIIVSQNILSISEFSLLLTSRNSKLRNKSPRDKNIKDDFHLFAPNSG